MKFRNLPHALYVIGTTEGLGPNGLYRGIQASWLIALSYATMNLAIYEPIKY